MFFPNTTNLKILKTINLYLTFSIKNGLRNKISSIMKIDYKYRMNYKDLTIY